MILELVSINSGRVTFYEVGHGCEHVYSMNEVIRLVEERPELFTDDTLDEIITNAHSLNKAENQH